MGLRELKRKPPLEAMRQAALEACCAAKRLQAELGGELAAFVVDRAGKLLAEVEYYARQRAKELNQQ